MNDFIAKAQKLLRWIDSAMEIVRAHPRVFGDLEFSGLELGLHFFQQKLIPEASRGLNLPVTAIVCGGTNTGKSTLVNSLARRVVSPTGGGIASYTKRIMAIGRIESLRDLHGSRPNWSLFPAAEAGNPGGVMQTLYGDGLPEWPSSLPVVFDTPDIDSSDQSCRSHSLSGLAFADVVVWLTTQQKYKDKAGMTFLDWAMAMSSRRIDVFNQYLPRHAEAFEDMSQYYRSRWPEAETVTIQIPEQPGIGEEGFLEPASTDPVIEALKEAARNGMFLKARNMLHGLTHVGARVIEASGKFSARIQDCQDLKNEINAHFEKTLFLPLQNLPGHAAPYELQAALVRTLEPKLQNTFGRVINDLNRSAGRAFGWAAKFIRGSAPVKNGETEDPLAVRDAKDRTAARNAFEIARRELLEDAKRRAGRDHPLFRKFHDDLIKLELPSPEEFAGRLEKKLQEDVREKLMPIVSRFEADLGTFCQENPNIMSALRAVVPGFSAVAALGAAIFTVHAMTILPGITEYLLGTVAFPIYSRLEKSLPEQLLTTVDRLGKEPFIQRAKVDFAKTRSSIFLEAAEWLVKPVEDLLILSGTKNTFDVASALKDLEVDWRTRYPEADPLSAKGGGRVS